MNFDPSQNTYALVTSTTYGTWLPGDERGFVNAKNNQYGTEFFRDNPLLKKASRVTPVYFRQEHAQLIFDRWLEIVPEYQWHLYAVAIMSNHFHVVVVAPGKVEKETFLRNFKSRASKALNDHFGKQTWWTTSGFVRFCFDEKTLDTRINYVMNQSYPLLVWITEEYD